MTTNNDATVFITGAANGIGYETGCRFLRNGYKVIFSDKEEEGLRKVRESLVDYQDSFRTVVCDVTSEEQIKHAISYVVEEFSRVDVVINNAGLQHVDKVEDFPTEKFRLMLEVMVTAPFVISKHCFPVMKKQGFGRIINVSSINGIIGFSGKAAYNSAKHGVNGLTKVLALEGAEFGITVNSICPGYADTALVRGQLEDLARARNVSLSNVLEEVIYPLVPQKRLIGVDEISSYMLYLSSHLAKGVTGQSIVIDGGYTVQ